MSTNSRKAFEAHQRANGSIVHDDDWRIWQASRKQASDEAVQFLLDAGYRSTGIPAYESLAEKLQELLK